MKQIEPSWGQGGCDVLDEVLTLAWEMWCDPDVGPPAPATQEVAIGTPSPKKIGKSTDSDEALIAHVTEMQTLLADLLEFQDRRWGRRYVEAEEQEGQEEPQPQEQETPQSLADPFGFVKRRPQEQEEGEGKQ